MSKSVNRNLNREKRNAKAIQQRAREKDALLQKAKVEEQNDKVNAKNVIYKIEIGLNQEIRANFNDRTRYYLINFIQEFERICKTHKLTNLNVCDNDEILKLICHLDSQYNIENFMIKTITKNDEYLITPHSSMKDAQSHISKYYDNDAYAKTITYQVAS